MPDKDSKPGTELPATLKQRWEAAGQLPCTLSAELPLPGVTVGDLLALNIGSVINSHCGHSSRVPVWVNGVTIGRGEFEVSGERLAIRITELC